MDFWMDESLCTAEVFFDRELVMLGTTFPSAQAAFDTVQAFWGSRTVEWNTSPEQQPNLETHQVIFEGSLPGQRVAGLVTQLFSLPADPPFPLTERINS